MRKFSYSVLILIALVALDRLFAGSDAGVSVRSQVPRFTLNDAILTALRQNPSIQITRQEIERTKGLYIQMRAEVLPKIAMTGQFQDIDPHLQVNHGAPSETGATPTPVPTATPIGGSSSSFSSFTSVERSYNVQIQATQAIFTGGRIISQIRAADFTRDSSYYGFRNASTWLCPRCASNFIRSCSIAR